MTSIRRLVPLLLIVAALVAVQFLVGCSHTTYDGTNLTLDTFMVDRKIGEVTAERSPDGTLKVTIKNLSTEQQALELAKVIASKVP